ncbi:MAG: hypothetical protein AAGE98_19985 [Actinomycetota bacterium]
MRDFIVRHLPGTLHDADSSGDDRTEAAMYIDPTLDTTRSTTTTTGWADLLAGEERHVASQDFGAGVLIISYAAELLAYADEDDRRLAEAAVLAVIDRHLGWTDRTSMVAPGRLGVVMVPVDGALALTRRAASIHRELRDRGLAADVSYSMRRRTGGLSAAAARADAALDSAVIRRRRRLLG